MVEESEEKTPFFRGMPGHGGECAGRHNPRIEWSSAYWHKKNQEVTERRKHKEHAQPRHTLFVNFRQMGYR
uniref:Uncharacterized protein n=1 Tax=viral metagenome TaxID=1070528 RepID=A0A6C0K5C7_9ZZZZ